MDHEGRKNEFYAAALASAIQGVLSNPDLTQKIEAKCGAATRLDDEGFARGVLSVSAKVANLATKHLFD